MGWLEDLAKTTVYNYREVATGSLISGTLEDFQNLFGDHLKCEPGETFTSPEGIDYEYAGFEPHAVGLTHKISFEKNGRVGMRTRFGDGGQYTRSMAKENLMNGKKSDSVITKGCREASDKARDKIVHGRIKQTIHDMKRENHELKMKGKK